jgi:hypothetical protein
MKNVEIENNLYEGRVKAITAYYGNLLGLGTSA